MSKTCLRHALERRPFDSPSLSPWLRALAPTRPASHLVRSCRSPWQGPPLSDELPASCLEAISSISLAWFSHWLWGKRCCKTPLILERHPNLSSETSSWLLTLLHLPRNSSWKPSSHLFFHCRRCAAAGDFERAKLSPLFNFLRMNGGLVLFLACLEVDVR